MIDMLEKIDMPEKIDALSVKQPGRVAMLVATHPAASKRITVVQKNIQTLRPSQTQYVVNTSEFERVKARLIANQKKVKGDPPSLYRPTLERRWADLMKPDNSGCIHFNESPSRTGLSGLY